MTTNKVLSPLNKHGFEWRVVSIDHLEELLVLTFEDQDHFSQEWTWREKGKEKTVVIHFERSK
jgi:hypothetical protein